MQDIGIFANTGYKVTENSILSIYGRSDHHNTTDRNETYKLNFTQFFGQFKLGVSHSTGLRNPTLFELYGTDNYGIEGNINLNPEKSETNELSAKYNFSDKLSFNSTAYRTKVSDRIESNAAYSKHENMILDINQEGLENELLFKGNNQSFSIFNNFSKSRKTNGQAQNRRPDLSYGGNYSKKFLKSFVGPFNLNLNYKYTGQQTDWDGAKNTRQKSTDIVNLSLTKNLFGNNFYLIITNLLNERYERPATYSAEGRQFKVKFRRSY
jgi:vitamin B12 transporter